MISAECFLHWKKRTGWKKNSGYLHEEYCDAYMFPEETRDYGGIWKSRNSAS